jgi:hypothetical protein
MKIATDYASCGPLGYVWRAVVEDLEENTPLGTGATELEALEDLRWQVDDRPALEALVEARILQLRMGETA